jgi:predicted transcriptional regulator
MLLSAERLWYNQHMNDIQELIWNLRSRGWTISAIADALKVTRSAVEYWRVGSRYPSNVLAVKHELERLLEREDIPKKKRFAAPKM